MNIHLLRWTKESGGLEVSRRSRRRHKNRRKKSDFLKKWRRRLVGLGVVGGLIYGIFFTYHNLYSMVVDYASTQTVNLATLMIKEAVGNSVLVSFNIDEVIRFKENKEGYVNQVYINTPKLNQLLVSASQEIEEKLLLVESGDLSELGLDTIDGGPYEEGILLHVPLTAALNLSLFHEYGPKFPVRATVVGNAQTDIKTNVKPYGINNAMLEILLTVSVRLKVGLPLKSEETVVNVSTPLVIKMISGGIPEYYYIGSSSSTTPLSPFTNESGEGGSQVKTPSASPDQNVQNGMENILLH